MVLPEPPSFMLQKQLNLYTFSGGQFQPETENPSKMERGVGLI